MHRFVRLVCVAFALIAQVTACSGSDTATLQVRLVTDVVPMTEFHEARITLSEPTVDGDYQQLASALHRAMSGVAYPRGQIVAVLKAKPGDVRINVELVHRAHGVVASQPALLRLTEDYTATVFIERTCLHVVCPGTASASAIACSRGQCVDPSCVDDDATNDQNCPPDLSCDSAAQCPDVDACAEQTCTQHRCIATLREDGCDEEHWCNPGAGCSPFEDTPPDRRCNTVCTFPGMPCEYGFYRCVDGEVIECAPFYVNGVCASPPDAGMDEADGGIPDASRDADLDASPDAARDASLDANLDGSADGAADGPVQSFSVVYDGMRGLTAHEFMLPRELDDGWVVGWVNGSPKFTAALALAPRGAVTVTVTRDVPTRLMCASPTGSSVEELDDPLTLTFDASHLAHDVYALALLDLQKTADSTVRVRFEVTSAPSDPELLGRSFAFDVLVENVDEFGRLTGPRILPSFSDSDADPDRVNCPTSAALSGDGLTVAIVAAPGTTSVGDGQIVIQPLPNWSEFPIATAPIEVATLNDADEPANAACHAAALSADGRYLLFTSAATNLVALPGSPSSVEEQLYLLDRDTHEFTLVSGRYAGGVLVEIADRGMSTSDSLLGAQPASVSADGRYVTFSSAATNLGVAAGFLAQTLLFDASTKSLAIASVDDMGVRATLQSNAMTISDDGNRILFTTADWSPGDGSTDAFHPFVRDVMASTTTGMDFIGGTFAFPTTAFARMSGDGSWMTFTAIDTSGMGPVAHIYARAIDDADTLVRVSADAPDAAYPGYYSVISRGGEFVAFARVDPFGMSGLLFEALLWNRATGATTDITSSIGGWADTPEGYIAGLPVGVAALPGGQARVLMLSNYGATDPPDGASTAAYACDMQLYWRDIP